MERTLRLLFDFQRFGQNGDLQQAIRTTHLRRQLTPEEMETVHAACGAHSAPSAAGRRSLIPDADAFGSLL